MHKNKEYCGFVKGVTEVKSPMSKFRNGYLELLLTFVAVNWIIENNSFNL
jgi:hypothetical protein